MWYNVRMRAEKNGRHTSGAERLVYYEDIQTAMQTLTQRALLHPNGTPDSVSVTLRTLKEEPQRIPALSVMEADTRTPEETRQRLRMELAGLGFDVEPILKHFYTVSHLRGAMLLHVETMKRLEPDLERGVRASCMDYTGNDDKVKNHKKEALCLASKVLHHPDIIGELCISDDPDYTTGYFATKQSYLRLTHIKKFGDPHGGRIFLYTGSLENVSSCIEYLQKAPIIVEI